MAEGMQKKNLDNSPDETRTFDHGEMKVASIPHITGHTPRGALLLHRRGLGAGGRHHPPYAPTLRIPKLNFREHHYFRDCLKNSFRGFSIA